MDINLELFKWLSALFTFVPVHCYFDWLKCYMYEPRSKYPVYIQGLL